MTAELEARKQIDARIQGFRIRIGRARAAAERAETLAEKVACCGRVKDIEQELASLQKRYWEEVAKLDDAAYKAGY